MDSDELLVRVAGSSINSLNPSRYPAPIPTYLTQSIGQVLSAMACSYPKNDRATTSPLPHLPKYFL
jgi:hypothetical protein